ncbi:MAG TPA: ComEC/Rec2 family competence protein [Candidatus Ozemobacteraceae bacterium]|nr:ComEC/Rec2 family competence protein [Candidatus Ozemobacteraceae bacterium]
MNRLARWLVSLIALFPFFLTSPVSGAVSGPSGRGSPVPLLEVTFLNVGQGDAILVRSNEKTILIDAGDDTYNAGNTIATFLRQEKIGKIDTAVITHPHGDHFGGFIELLKQVSIGEFIYSTDDLDKIDPAASRADKSLLNDLRKTILARKIPYRQVKSGDPFDWGRGITVELLHAAEDVDLASWTASYTPGANDYSLAFKVTAGSVSYLFTGDLQAPGEETMLKKWGPILGSTILKLGHHGSRTSSSQPFLDVVRPEYAIVQVGKSNAFNHPSSRTLNRLKAMNIPVFRTDRNGTMTSVTDGTTETFAAEQGSFPRDILAAVRQLDSVSDQEVASDKYEMIQNMVCDHVRENLAAGNVQAVRNLFDGLSGTAAEKFRHQIREILLFDLMHKEAGFEIEGL